MKENKVCFKVYGRYALFSDPITRVGGEKMSYQVPTYQALVGILESIYWKPTFRWYVDRVRIVNPIRTEAKGVRPIPYGKGPSTLSKYTYLVDPLYIVEAHFEWEKGRPDLVDDRNERKHLEIANRMIERGGRYDIFLGTRECQGYVAPCSFDEIQGCYDYAGDLSLGLMFHSFGYPDETAKDEFVIRFWNVSLHNGVINFPMPHECRPEFTRVLPRDASRRENK